MPREVRHTLMELQNVESFHKQHQLPILPEELKVPMLKDPIQQQLEFLMLYISQCICCNQLLLH